MSDSFVTTFCGVCVAISACNSSIPPPPPIDPPLEIRSSPTPQDILEVSPCPEQSPASLPPKRLTGGTVSGGVLNKFVVCGILPEFDTSRYEQGRIIIDVVFDGAGFPISVTSEEKDPILRRAALNAVKHTHFRPVRLRDEPVSVRGVVIYAYSREKGVWIPETMPVEFQEDRNRPSDGHLR